KEAEKSYLDVVRGDAGRTELSGLALNNLAAQLRQDQAMAALDCLTASLALDRGNPNTLAATIELLKKQKFDAEADALTSWRRPCPSPRAVPPPCRSWPGPPPTARSTTPRGSTPRPPRVSCLSSCATAPAQESAWARRSSS